MELEPYRDLRDRDLRREGLLVAEGRWLVERLLASGWEVLSVLCAPRFAGHFRELAAGRCPVLTADEERLAKVAGFPFHRGVLAAARRPRFPSLAAWLSGAAQPAGQGRAGGDILVICPQLTGEYNLGSIVRSAAALGATALAMGARCCDPLSRRVASHCLRTLPQVDEHHRQPALPRPARQPVQHRNLRLAVRTPRRTEHQQHLPPPKLAQRHRASARPPQREPRRKIPHLRPHLPRKLHPVTVDEPVLRPHSQHARPVARAAQQRRPRPRTALQIDDRPLALQKLPLVKER